MGGFFDGFVRQASITKLNQNNRDMKDVAKGIGQVVAHAVAQQERINAEEATNAELREEIGRLRQEVVELDFESDQWICHYVAQKAKADYLMDELDRICADQGRENPARVPAYKDPDTLRIPSGDREGEAMTSADHAYIDAFTKKFVERFAQRWTHLKNWKDFLHAKVSY
ncbi:hypothetical protein [Ruegeria sp. 6PALISEP08]|uniref:hypothetical protein n=1 Tax=Ruegeria sp. 6PALISEP08 TaxID=1225660 RepID=UPI00067F0374|nr:hypothetical protein [Ruegeria sp. 6PALISEP08]